MQVAGRLCRLHISLWGTVMEMECAETLGASEVLSLPQDLFIDIGSCLNERDVCNMELAGKKFYDILSRPSRIGLCGGELHLGPTPDTPLTPEALRSPFCP